MANDKSFARLKPASSKDAKQLEMLVASTTSSEKGTATLDASRVASVVQRTARNVTDIRNLFKVLPWLHLPKDILVSSVVSPGDLVSTTLNIRSEPTAIPSRLSTQMDQALRDYFLKEYRMDQRVSKWIEEALVMKGAYPIMIVPEMTIDKMVNGSQYTTEALKTIETELVGEWYRPKGLLGPARVEAGHSVESFESDDYLSRYNKERSMIVWTHNDGKGCTKDIVLPISVTDNPISLRASKVTEVRRKKVLGGAFGAPAMQAAIRSRSGLSLEAKKKADKNVPSREEIYDQYFKSPRRNSGQGQVEILQTSTMKENKGLGHPMEFHLPSVAVAPIFTPGDETRHEWYIVIHDHSGYPVAYKSNIDYYNDMRNYIHDSGSEQGAAGDIINLAKSTQSGNIDDIPSEVIDQLTDQYAGVIEADIINRIRNGILGSDVEFSLPDQIKRMMFARTMQNKQTTMTLVPAEYMVYMAYDYNDFGVGKSILEDGMSHAAHLAALEVANTIGSIQNALPGKDITIQLDPADNNPQQTALDMASEGINLAYRQLPSVVGTASGLAEQLQLSAFNINVEGNPKYPDVKTTIAPRESSINNIDTEFANKKKDELIAYLGVSPEMVDSMNQPDFATTVVSNNINLQKRVKMIQAKTNPFLTDYVRIFTYNSGILLDRLFDIVDNSKEKIPEEYANDPTQLIEDYINSVECTLPEPRTESLQKAGEALETLGNAVDIILEAKFPEEALAPLNDPRMEEAYPVMKAQLRSKMLARYIDDHAILPELDLFRIADDGKPVFSMAEELTTQSANYRELMGDYLTSIYAYVKRNKSKIDALREKGEKAEAVIEGTVEEPEQTDDFSGGLDDVPDADGADALGGDDGLGDDGDDLDDPDTTLDDDTTTDDDDLGGLTNPPE